MGSVGIFTPCISCFLGAVATELPLGEGLAAGLRVGGIALAVAAPRTEGSLQAAVWYCASRIGQAISAQNQAWGVPCLGKSPASLPTGAATHPRSPVRGSHTPPSGHLQWPGPMLQSALLTAWEQLGVVNMNTAHGAQHSLLYPCLRTKKLPFLERDRGDSGTSASRVVSNSTDGRLFLARQVSSGSLRPFHLGSSRSSCGPPGKIGRRRTSQLRPRHLHDQSQRHLHDQSQRHKVRRPRKAQGSYTAAGA